MGQVSILEDIEKAIENLQSEISRLPPPTEVAVKAQSKRIEKEQERLKNTATQLLALTKALDSNLKSTAMQRVSDILSMQVDLKKREKLNAEILLLETKLKSLKAADKRIAGLEEYNVVLSKMINNLTLSLPKDQRPDVPHKPDQGSIDQKISKIVNAHPITRQLKIELKRALADLREAKTAQSNLKKKLFDLQQLLNSKSASKR